MEPSLELVPRAALPCRPARRPTNGYPATRWPPPGDLWVTPRGVLLVKQVLGGGAQGETGAFGAAFQLTAGGLRGPSLPDEHPDGPVDQRELTSPITQAKSTVPG